MRESVTYQAVLEEGRLEERRSMVIGLLEEGVQLESIAKVSGWSIEEINRLKEEINQ